MILFPLVVNYTLLHQASEWIADASDGSMAVSISTVMPEQPSVAYDFVRKIDDHFRSVVPKVILENLRAFKRLRDSSKDTSAKYVQLTIKSLSDQLKSKFMDQIQDSNLAQKRFVLLNLVFHVTHDTTQTTSSISEESHCGKKVQLCTCSLCHRENHS